MIYRLISKQLWFRKQLHALNEGAFRKIEHIKVFDGVFYSNPINIHDALIMSVTFFKRCGGSRCPQRWSSLLAFRRNGTLCDLCTQFNSYALDVPEFRHQNYEQICDRCDIGDRIPAFFLNNLDRVIRFSNNVDNSEHYFDFEIELNHWYNIVFEQNSVNGKVIY